MTVLTEFLGTTGFAMMTWGNLFMIVVGLIFITLAITKDYEPLLLLPIGFGAMVGNIPSIPGMALSVYDPGSVLAYLYFGVSQGIFPPLIFLGIGAMTDFSTMLSNPRLVLLGAAAQVGIFLTLMGALYLGFTPEEAGAIGIIGGADGPTAIFLSAKLAPHLIGAIAIAAYSYMALVPVIQPPVMKLLTTRKERLIRMPPPREVSKRERIFFPIIAFLVAALIAPGSLALVGMLMFGNLLKESGVTDRLADTARHAFIDIVTILLGFSVGASTQAQTFLTPQSLSIFGLGALSFAMATAGGILFCKFLNLFTTQKVNPLLGAAGVSAVPDSARVVQMVGLQEDPHNHLLMNAMAPNVAGVIGSAICAGILWSVMVG
ncbi:MAG TPA: sodium ion-translocating decarboxylase subunit beta [Candidatus Latescibacteria bacterium]|jgi:oxaloacetate decarboxylase beta subunit|nr:glutaconyl-CoA decarboxylase subunit beta [Gemmatimonadota bacterium]MDP7362863.1 sodium ion-translocating decarboxylase subunit beta [Candidatus Latescibacterota bacterium]MBU11015.1 glutaconyl-CoA decarboxylase subunit beta [Gemmatimonadota bacterium]MDP7633937.1 sodium ion-translocating decarboxylase subunit beta [Candidatus Latescibacterota bacterium]HCV25876.1 glutaconyl-CoA decarboxylase subunit beta [Candidatus Latescibacterota bacterium]|tara:strand:- start:360 stop:1487 length:1128 start_codon:yes stop_codon:yes gene_type:complete